MVSHQEPNENESTPKALVPGARVGYLTRANKCWAWLAGLCLFVGVSVIWDPERV